ncbi:selenite/tellurite reduction operon c-type cytochrome lipoprotein ExtS [Geomonas azotofigens]|uniref:selenite/tellurite reduction operon c-type cytochrome lipoprotein ExtS n=1 Tax=Geomonas azotofigens TaxID=2843196 RepID=UPI001C100B71|nr:selenite/tellurite reduction operon c-type cytochrome lipoprotein ExtS [Geomonas azotofigens]MBU5611781.1 c-type cytochrome [Geomonas azotofigens]
MAVRTPLLIALALLVAPVAAHGVTPSCLECHPAHYRSVGSCVTCHGGDPRSDRPRIAHHDLVPGRFAWFAVPGSAPTRRGRDLVEQFACRRCHIVGGKGNRLAADLDRLPAGTTAQRIFEAIGNPALLMPQFHFDERQKTDLVNAVLAGVREAEAKRRRGKDESPQVVHFQDGKSERDNVFEKRCGDCHRALTRAVGGVGRGAIGPNLSGLLSEFYPKTAAGRTRWSEGALKKWLENPRQSRERTQMRPIRLPEGELTKLVNILAGRQGL